jgi:hypothetical protein
VNVVRLLSISFGEPLNCFPQNVTRNGDTTRSRCSRAENENPPPPLDGISASTSIHFRLSFWQPIPLSPSQTGQHEFPAVECPYIGPSLNVRLQSTPVVQIQAMGPAAPRRGFNGSERTVGLWPAVSRSMWRFAPRAYSAATHKHGDAGPVRQPRRGPARSVSATLGRRNAAVAMQWPTLAIAAFGPRKVQRWLQDTKMGRRSD